MKWSEVRVGLPAEDQLQEMASIGGKPVDIRITALQPTRQEIERKRKAIHLGEKSNEKCAEGTERAPVAGGLRPEEAEGEDDENNGVDENQAPQPIGGDPSAPSWPRSPSEGVFFLCPP